MQLGGDYGDGHWKWQDGKGAVSGANETGGFIIGSLGATRMGWKCKQHKSDIYWKVQPRRIELRRVIKLALMTFL